MFSAQLEADFDSTLIGPAERTARPVRLPSPAQVIRSVSDHRAVVELATIGVCAFTPIALALIRFVTSA